MATDTRQKALDSAIKEIDIQKTDEKNLIKLVAQDLFQELEEKELQAKLKCILSVPSRGIPPLTTSKNRTHE